MRSITINLLAIALLLFGATSAHAYAINLDIGGTTIDSSTTSTVTVNVLLDVSPGDEGTELLSVAVLGDVGTTTYDQGASSNPSYILFSPFGGKGLPSVYLVPSQTPMQTWPAPATGKEQVNVNWQEVNLGTTRATGLGINLATLVFNIATGTSGSLDLSLNSGGNIVRVNGTDIKATVALGPGVTIVPEPALAGLGLAAITTIAGLRRWRRRA